MDYNAFSGTTTNDLQACSCCGRTFNPETLQKHQRICKKVENKSKSRKVFNSAKQRAIDSDVPLTKAKKTQPIVVTSNPVKITNWREQHLDFINSIRSARQVSKALKTGGPLPPPPPPSINPDYIQCPHCSRRFNRKAGERHIPFCATRSKTFGAPVKPLHKTAVADVGYSSTGIRKSYDSNVVRRKPNGGVAYSGRNFEDDHFRAMQERSRTNIGFGRSSFASRPTSNYSSTGSQKFGKKTLRPKSAKLNQHVRFADTSSSDGYKTSAPKSRYPSHDPPTYSSVGSGNRGMNQGQENGDDRSRYGSQGSFRTTKASQLRSMSRNQSISVGGARDASMHETTTTLDLSGVQNGGLNQRGRSPRSMSPAKLQPTMQNGLSPRPPTSPRGQQNDGKVLKEHSSPSVSTSFDEATGSPAPFCYNCGTMFPLPDARFCCGCGIKRAYLTPI
ncbi:uncharacterized protein [Antedon mediterranea]|uniref:uncharacterized protein n=1 Tax=Antedon mediterranea TaxID=105859 RepID=UPI003AF45F05